MRDARCNLREGNTLIGVIEELMMGAYSTTPLRASGAADESAATENSQQVVSNPPERTLSALLSRIAAWLIFIGGIVGAVLGIAGLHVEITVAGLILACTAGLVLLKLRADGASRTG
ncbi:hypothetical protein ACQP0C_08260 [Nocardia sp. CA-129566]|uniref:hypothetical protein n=1 Tax=Nocardia sp. CA-129566 TaxID=3239976 RepID=UPI003D998B7E